jgi:hypothetical protein
VLDQKKKDAVNVELASDLKNANLTEECPHCHEEVRIGLVRCWKCSGFMRDDIAKQYRDMTAKPQPIIYSDVPAAERTDFIPARTGESARHHRPNVFDADDDFSLDDNTQMSSAAVAPEFELETPSGTAASPQAPASTSLSPQQKTDGPDKPESKTPGEKSDKGGADGPAADKDAKQTSDDKSTSDVGVDELLSIAIQEQKEVKQRRQLRVAEHRAKRMLIPCRCGAWIRVHERQAGRVVRCRQCKQRVAVPEIRRKAEKKAKVDSSPQVQITWLDDIWFHALTPTSLVLKPGSLTDDHTLTDLGFTADTLYVVRRAADAGRKKKKGLFGAGGGKQAAADVAAWREACRKHIADGNSVSDIPDTDVQNVASERAAELKLVQPIIKAQESMFAGVPVFGEGRIAIFLPMELPDGQQAFCSLSLTAYRTFSEKLKSVFNLTLPGEENGVPQTEKQETHSCHYSQTKVEGIRDLPYYQQDPAFELTLTGCRCVNCRIVVSEESRQKNKLGGANGKAIAKAKCPKCGGKFGNEPLYTATTKSAEQTTDS